MMHFTAQMHIAYLATVRSRNKDHRLEGLDLAALLHLKSRFERIQKSVEFTYT